MTVVRGELASASSRLLSRLAREALFGARSGRYLQRQSSDTDVGQPCGTATNGTAETLKRAKLAGEPRVLATRFGACDGGVTVVFGPYGDNELERSLGIKTPWVLVG